MGTDTDAHRHLSAGDVIRWGTTSCEKLVLIQSGCLEGTVEEIIDGHSLDHHPLGREVDSSKDRSTRRPNILVAGSDSVLGCSPFLSRAHCVEYRCRNSVCVYELSKKADPETYDNHLVHLGQAVVDPNKNDSEVRAALQSHTQEEGCPFLLFRNVSALNLPNRKTYKSFPDMCVPLLQISAICPLTHGLCDQIDIDIAGMVPEELNTFYRGIAINIATQLCRARMEAIRISECKAFNDRQTVLRVSIRLSTFLLPFFLWPFPRIGRSAPSCKCWHQMCVRLVGGHIHMPFLFLVCDVLSILVSL